MVISSGYPLIDASERICTCETVLISALGQCQACGEICRIVEHRINPRPVADQKTVIFKRPLSLPPRGIFRRSSTINFKDHMVRRVPKPEGCFREAFE